MNKLLPIVIGVLVILLALPLLHALKPKTIDFRKIQDAFAADGMSVTAQEIVNPAEYGAAAEMRMRVNACEVMLLQFKDEETVKKKMEEFEKLAALPAVGDVPKMAVARNALFMLVVKGRNDQVRERMVYVFRTT